MTRDLERLCGGDQLKLLLTISKTRSFSLAASQLGVTQPSVSQQVKRIENIVGRPLFRRARSGIALTPEGEAVIIYANAIYGLTQNLKRHLDSNFATARINVGMSEDFVRTVVPGVLWLFMREHPHVEVQITSGSYDLLMKAIEDRAVDFTIMRRYSEIPNAQLLWREPSVWVGSSDLPLPLEDPIPLVLPVAPNPVRELMTDSLSAAGRTWTIRFQSPSLASNEAAMQARFGIVGAPQSMRLYGVGPLDVQKSGLPPLRDVEFVLVKTDSDMSPIVQAFAAILLKAAEAKGGAPSMTG